MRGEQGISSRPVLTYPLETYLECLSEVPGHLDETDAHVLIALLRDQHEAGVAGDILEIGAWFGRSSILLGYMLEPGENLVVNDPFEMPPTTDSERREREKSPITPRRSAFEQHYLRYHGRLPEIVQHSSSDLAGMLPQDRRFRFVHVDGSHTFDAVRGDIELSTRITAAGGIVAFDDYANTGHPAVAAALWPALAVGRLEPFAATGAKLYASNDLDLATRYRDVVERVALDRAWEVLRTPIAGLELLTVRNRAPSRRLHARAGRRLRRSIARRRISASN